jgi:hypothetical protein
MLAKVSCISWVIGLLTLSGGLFAQEEEEWEPPELSRAEWKRLRSLRKVRPLFWIGPLQNKAVYGICFTPFGFREHYNAVVNGLNLEVLGIGTAYTFFPYPGYALRDMYRSFASMDTIPEVYNFQVNGISLGSGFVQRGVLNGIGVGGGLIGKLNGISVGVFHCMYRANGLVIGVFGNAIAEMRGLGIDLFSNVVGFRMRGVQLAFFGNAVSNGRILEDSLPNKERGLIGLQVGGFNIVSYSASGMQIGFLNGVDGKLEGIQMGLMNIGNTLQGMQISAYTNKCRALQGVQIGLYNECSSLRGVQIGLLNFCERRLSPFLRVKLKDRRPTTSEPSSESLP